MKKIYLIIFIFLINVSLVSAKEINVKFNKCVDGDTAKFLYKDEIITTRFLAIDTPEIKHGKNEADPYGNEAKDYTCEKIKNAENIRLEFDENSDEKDKYDRYLVWVFVDDKLLQKELVNKGLAKVAYIYDDYKYTSDLEKAEKYAKKNKLGIWSNKKEVDYKEIIILIGIIIMLCIFSVKARKVVTKEVKKELKKDIKKKIKNLGR